MNLENRQLLHDLLDGQDAAAARNIVLEAGLLALRRKRHVRYLTRTLAAAACVGLAVLAITRESAPHSPLPQPGDRLATKRSPQAVFHVKEITDKELLALFPDTPVGLAKVNGKELLIFPRPGDEKRFVMRF